MTRPTLLLAALAATVSMAAGVQSLESTTYIEPAKSFLLGGGQAGAFTVKGRNSGEVPVTVFVERAGRRDSIATVSPGKSLDAEFPTGAMAVFRNESDGLTAVLRLTVRGKIDNLGMRYEAARR